MFEIAQVFDCQKMPGCCGSYEQFPGGYYDEQNLSSKFLRLFQEKGNDTYVEWNFLQETEECILEDYNFWHEHNSQWKWKCGSGEAIIQINNWLLANGADPEKTILIAHWW